MIGNNQEMSKLGELHVRFSKMQNEATSIDYVNLLISTYYSKFSMIEGMQISHLIKNQSCVAETAFLTSLKNIR